MSNARDIIRGVMARYQVGDRSGDWAWDSATDGVLRALNEAGLEVGPVASLRSSLHAVVTAYRKANPMRTADFHVGCDCLRCAVDRAEALLDGGEAMAGAAPGVVCETHVDPVSGVKSTLTIGADAYTSGFIVDGRLSGHRTIDGLYAALSHIEQRYLREEGLEKGLANDILQALLDWRAGSQQSLDALSGHPVSAGRPVL